MTIEKSFCIGETKFYEYYARDAHGSRCSTYMVNSKCVDSMTYNVAIVTALKDSGSFESIFRTFKCGFFTREN